MGLHFKQIIINCSLGGSYVFKSSILPFPEAVDSQVEIHTEVFLDGNDLEKGFDVFTNFVYQDLKSITQPSEANLFESFFLETIQKDAKTNQEFSSRRSWNLDAIITSKEALMQDITNCTKNRLEMHLKLLIKAKNLLDVPLGEKGLSDQTVFYGFEEDSQDADTTLMRARTIYTYLSAKKFYHFHFYNVKEKKGTSFTFHPLISLGKNVFFSEEAAIKYASFFYNDSQVWVESPGFSEFVMKQVKLLPKNWKRQKLLDT